MTLKLIVQLGPDDVVNYLEITHHCWGMWSLWMDTNDHKTIQHSSYWSMMCLRESADINYITWTPHHHYGTTTSLHGAFVTTGFHGLIGSTPHYHWPKKIIPYPISANQMLTWPTGYASAIPPGLNGNISWASITISVDVSSHVH